MVFSSHDAVNNFASVQDKEKEKEKDKVFSTGGTIKTRSRVRVTPFHMLLFLYSLIALAGIVYRMCS